MSSSVLRFLVGPVDRLLLILHLFRRTAHLTGPIDPPEVGEGNARAAIFPSRDRKGWPSLRLPLPEGSVFHDYAEAICRRVGTWMVPEDAESTMNTYRDVLAEIGVVESERRAGDVWRLRGSVDHARVDIALAEPPTGVRVLAITQYSR